MFICARLSVKLILFVQYDKSDKENCLALFPPDTSLTFLREEQVCLCPILIIYQHYTIQSKPQMFTS